MDAIERFQDAGGKAKYLNFFPNSVLIRTGPTLQRAAACAGRLVTGRYSSHGALPDGSRRVYLYHVRKTAGTSLHRSFCALGGEDPDAVERRIGRSLMSRTESGGYVFTCGRGIFQQGDFFFGWSHLASHRVQLPDRTFTIALLRDPIARVLSYYRYLLSGDSGHADMTWHVQGDERALAGRCFAEFLDNVPDELLLNQLYMFSARFDVSEAVDRISHCSAIMMTESYERDLEKLALTLGLPLRYRRDRVTGVAAVKLSEAELGVLRRRLDPEYELLEKLAGLGLLDRG